jgi:hypothetical protein
MEQNFGTFW